MLVSLTVGKVDAGVTVLLTEDKRLIEFPSILLPPNISSGSIVDITVGRNRASEQKAQDGFAALQARIQQTFGEQAPTTPVLRCRNATQTSVVLEWDAVQLATADLLGLSLYRNDQKAGNIPRPLQMHSTKISGLAVDTAYTFHLVLRTSAGTFASNKLAVRTHKMTDLSGITITTGLLQPPALRERLAAAVERIGARLVPEPGLVRIDTTHFVTTEGRGLAWEKATELSIPVVRPDWVEACEKSGRILGVTKFYLDAVRPAAPGPAGPSAAAASPQRHQDKTLPPAPPAAAGTPTPASSSAASSAEATQPAATPAPAAETTTPSSPPPPEAPSGSSSGSAHSNDEADQQPGPNNLALRPKDSRESSDEEDEEEADAEEKPKESDNDGGRLKAAAAPAGDGGSFQDVAL